MKTDIISELVKYDSYIEKELQEYSSYKLKRISPIVFYYQIIKPYIQVEEMIFSFQKDLKSMLVKKCYTHYFSKKSDYKKFTSITNKTYIATEHDIDYYSKCIIFAETKQFYIHLNLRKNSIYSKIDISLTMKKDFNNEIKKSNFENNHKLMFSQQDYDSIITNFNN